MSAVGVCIGTEEAPLMEDEEKQKQQQFLVRFRDVTHVLNVPMAQQQHNNSSIDDYHEHVVLHELSRRTGWPRNKLRIITNSGCGNSSNSSIIGSPPVVFVSVTVVSSIVGGKGGFGTLLKGQSKQAGARMTTDFGACRDLQGRRLRHVNDEIKLRKWRDIQRKKAEGIPVDEIKELQTESGLYNWHLMVPNWASDSLSSKAIRKEQRKWERQVKKWQSQEEEARQAKMIKQAQYEQSVSDYVRRTTDASDAIHSNIADAIQQGLLQQQKQQQQLKEQKQKQQQQQQQQQKEIETNSSSRAAAVAKKRKRDDEDDDDSNDEDDDDDADVQPQPLVTLSGDVVVQEDETTSGGVTQIQSKSDFATVALVLEGTLSTIITDKKSLWFEVRVVTGGLAQVGWAARNEKEFAPNNDTGDGVGDDAGSFAYDGSRSLKFHKGTEESYGYSDENTTWKAGDVIGCRYDPTSGEISYSCNGNDLGVAFTTTPQRFLVPAMSCNQGEILELHVKEEEMKHMPPNCVPVHSLLVLPSSVTRAQEEDEKDDSSNSKSAAKEENEEKTKPKTAPPPQNAKEAPKTEKPVVVEAPDKKPVVAGEPVDLDSFQSVEELMEQCDMDRLKGALLALGVKCGGSLEERATRLFSLKGLKREDYPKKVRGKNFVV